MEDDLRSLVESIGQLNAMQVADNDQHAVELYRAIFRNDVDINKLDFNYADAILGYVEFGVDKAEVDYRNYLGYLKMISPEEYQSHLDMFKDAIRHRDDDIFDDDEE